MWAALETDMNSHYINEKVSTAVDDLPAAECSASEVSSKARSGRWYTARVQRDQWARLTAPFSPEALIWGVAELAAASSKALLEPHWSAVALRQRFDEVLGTDGWSYQLSPVGERAIICNLTLEGNSRAAVAEVRLVTVDGDDQRSAAPNNVTDLAELALARAAAQFGIAPALDADAESYWVDYDPDAGEALFLPQTSLVSAAGPPRDDQEGSSEPPSGQTSDQASAQSPSGQVPAAGGEGQTAGSEGQAVIQRLIDRLNAEGLGREAAKLVVEYHGYGRTPEEARELYGRLRALLVGQGEEP